MKTPMPRTTRRAQKKNSVAGSAMTWVPEMWVYQALWLLTVFLGNAIDMAISGTHVIPAPATEFFFYALLMVLVMGVFILLAMRYTYVEDQDQAEPMDRKERIPTEDTTC